MSRALLIGEAPGRGEVHGTDSWSRLAKVLGFRTNAEMWKHVRLRNLLTAQQVRQGKGATFPLLEAAAAAQRVRFGGAEVVILAGTRVAAAFGLGVLDVGYRYCLPFPLLRRGSRVTTCVVIPHPSGINRWYNSARNRARVRRVVRGLLGLYR